MDIYLKNLLPRLKAYGQKLDKIESFVDKTWAKYDTVASFQTYRFLRNGKLLIANSGFVNEFDWKYLAPDSLYVKSENFKGHDGIMYRQGFLLDALLVMFIEGNEYKPVIFYNELAIPNGDVVGYLQRLFIKKHNLKNTHTEGKYFYTSEFDTGIVKGSRIFDNNLEELNDKIITIGDSEYTIKNNRVISVSTRFYLKSSLGDISVISPAAEIVVNSKVFSLEGKALNGKIRIIDNNSISSIKVKNGLIVNINTVGDSVFVGFIMVVIVLIGYILYLFLVSASKETSQPQLESITNSDSLKLADSLKYVDSLKAVELMNTLAADTIKKDTTILTNDLIVDSISSQQ